MSLFDAILDAHLCRSNIGKLRLKTVNPNVTKFAAYDVHRTLISLTKFHFDPLASK